MPKRINVSQIQNKLRQAQAQYRQAAQKYNSEIRRYNNQVRARNTQVNAAINNYNRQVRAYNARVRANQSRLQSAFRHLSQQSITTRYTAVYHSTQSLVTAYETLDANNADPYLSDLAERETANSVQVLNSLLEDSSDPLDITTDLASTTITDVLTKISYDLNDRWEGALFALHPSNPDAARHFCTSVREIIASILTIEAPDLEVIQELPHCELVRSGIPTRRAKLQFLLLRQGIANGALEDFADANVTDVVNLFPVLNAGAHGTAGKYSMTQLEEIKTRVEGAIEFICAIARP